MENSQRKENIIGERIRLLREAHGWVVGRFAQKLRMTIADCTAIENGKLEISESQLTKMAAVLCVDAKKLGSAEPQDIADMLADQGPNSAYKRKPKLTVVELEAENEKLRALVEKKEIEIAILQKKLIDAHDQLARKS